MVYAARRMGICMADSKAKPPRKHDRRYPELLRPGEKVQIDVKEVPYSCLKGAMKQDGKRLYQWTAIDELAGIGSCMGLKSIRRRTRSSS